jgi:nicotinate-nucleotide pyrophosphorylase (carboxylating)
MVTCIIFNLAGNQMTTSTLYQHLPDYLNEAIIAEQVRTALQEDIGGGDLTAALIPAATPASATIISREAAVICG